MAPVKTSSLIPRAIPRMPAIRIGQSDHLGAETRYGTMLTWFMRVLALLWMGQGLWSWAMMLTGTGDGGSPFETLSDEGQAAVMFFAVLDLLAAVGLWLASSWGGVVWLVAVAAQWLSLVLMADVSLPGRVVGIADLALVAAYFVLTYLAASEIDR